MFFMFSNPYVHAEKAYYLMFTHILFFTCRAYDDEK